MTKPWLVKVGVLFIKKRGCIVLTHPRLSQEINVDVQPITQPSVAQLTNSNYKLGQALPKDLRSSLPSIEEIEEEVESF